MATNVLFKLYNAEELKAKWGNGVWEWTPSTMIALPFQGKVLFGAEEPHNRQRVSFILFPDDAMTFGQMLMDAGKQAGAK